MGITKVVNWAEAQGSHAKSEDFLAMPSRPILEKRLFKKRNPVDYFFF